MATGGDHVTAAAAGEETPLRKTDQGAADAELSAPSGWTKKVNPTRPGKFEVIFVAPTGEEMKTKRAVTQYLKKNPGGPAVSEFNWGTGDTPRRSSRLSEKVKATESSEDEKPAPAKRGRSSSKKSKKEDAEDEDEKPAKRGRPSSSKKGKKGKQEDAEEAPAESGDHVDAEEAKGTDVEMKDAQEEKKEPDTAQEEKKDVPMVDAAEKTEEVEVKTDGSELAEAAEKTEEPELNTEVSEVPADAAGKAIEAEVNTEVSELPKVADAAGKTEEAEVNTEVSELPKVADAAGKTEEAEVITEVSELPMGADAAEKTSEAEVSVVLPSDVSAPVAENKGDGKPAESEVVAPLEGEKTENGLVMESTGPPVVEKKEEAINPATPPPVEVNADAPAAKEAENSADKAAAQKDEDQANAAVNVDNNGQIQLGASTVKCT